MRNQYDVLRIVEMITDNTNQNRLVFKDSKGKIVFIDKNEVDVDKSIFEVGKKYLAWVTKDLDKQSYARFTIDGILITYFISNKINALSMRNLYDIAESKPFSDCIMFSNDMYNYDIDFNESQKNIENMHLNKHLIFKDIENMTINSELSEFVYELGVLFTYVYNVYNKNRLKEIK